MYYEIFDELHHCQLTGSAPDAHALVKKSLLDGIFEVHSLLAAPRSVEADLQRLVGSSYPYFYYQKIMGGMAMALFLGLDVTAWSGQDIFHPQGRLRIPDSELTLHLARPTLHFKDDREFSFANSQLQLWLEGLMAISEPLSRLTGVVVTVEGFRAHLYRIIEHFYAMATTDPRRRGKWITFLHDLLVMDRKFSREELEAKGFTITPERSCRVEDPEFIYHDYLEFNLMKQLGTISSTQLSQGIELGSVVSDPTKAYSLINQGLLGRLPLCNLYVNEHMFVGKEEYSLNQYHEYYIRSWTTANDIILYYQENGTGLKKEAPIADFARELKDTKYSLVFGYSQGGQYFYARPRMVKD
jgi:hypothetical protein